MEYVVFYGSLAVIAAALLLASVQDARTGEISNAYAIIIAVIAFALMIINYLPWQNIITGFIFGGVMLTAIIVTKSTAGAGGGDIKLITACALLTGGAYALLAYAMLFVISSIYYLISKKEYIRLAPIISVSYFPFILIVYFTYIQGGLK